MSLTILRESHVPAESAREFKASLRRADRRRLVNGKISREQLSREVSIVDPAGRPGVVQFSIHGSAKMRLA